LADFSAAVGRGLAGQAAAAATGVVGGEGGLPERDAQVGLKTGWENPVPTATESRKNRSYTISEKKTGTKKQEKIGRNRNRNRKGHFPDRFHGYRIVYRNSRQLFPFSACRTIQPTAHKLASDKFMRAIANNVPLTHIINRIQ